MGRPAILVVVQNRTVATTVVSWLDAENYQLVVLDNFLSAKAQLSLRPAALVSELRLGEYNGLHLALRARSLGIPSVVVGEPDPVLEADATNMGAIYIRTPELERERVLSVIEGLVRSETGARDVALGGI